MGGGGQEAGDGRLWDGERERAINGLWLLDGRFCGVFWFDFIGGCAFCFGWACKKC